MFFVTGIPGYDDCYDDPPAPRKCLEPDCMEAAHPKGEDLCFLHALMGYLDAAASAVEDDDPSYFNRMMTCVLELQMEAQ